MHHPALVQQPGQVDVRTFFGDMCPRALALRDADAQGGRAAFFLSGERGGAWVIDLSARVVEVGGPRRAVDLVCAMGVLDFEALIRGELDVAAALEARDVEIAGEREILRALSELFARGSSARL